MGRVSFECCITHLGWGYMDQHYDSLRRVLSNDISILKGWGGVQFPEKRPIMWIKMCFDADDPLSWDIISWQYTNHPSADTDTVNGAFLTCMMRKSYWSWFTSLICRRLCLSASCSYFEHAPLSCRSHWASLMVATCALNFSILLRFMARSHSITVDSTVVSFPCFMVLLSGRITIGWWRWPEIRFEIMLIFSSSQKNNNTVCCISEDEDYRSIVSSNTSCSKLW